jgi:sigma-B regulation protein RsbU (phosphoserine phosphatase)
MAMTCALFHSYPGAPSQPGKVLRYLNEHLCQFAEPSFITGLYVIFDANRRSLKIARAGHPPPMIYRAADNTAHEVPCKGVFPLGIDSYDDVPETNITLDPGDRLLMYTDGLTERFSPQGELYGEERLLSQLKEADANDPQLILDSIITDLDRFAGGQSADDDQALLVGVVQ